VSRKSLSQIAAEKPFPEYGDWWDIGQEFLSFIAEAIVSQWSKLHSNRGNLAGIRSYVTEYLRVVYHRETIASLVDDFARRSFSRSIQSGEFDALSYAFYRSAFDLIERHGDVYTHSLEVERRLFTQRVGTIFFRLLQDHLNLELPTRLDDERDFIRLKDSIRQLGAFLKEQGYLRDHFDFRYAIDVECSGRRIAQSEAEFLEKIKRNETAYAVYEMGYPVILPSAVYLYHTIGEAQHHSSRTIEELFERIGYKARETDDFDPIDYPSDSVIELWEISEGDV